MDEPTQNYVQIDCTIHVVPVIIQDSKATNVETRALFTGLVDLSLCHS